MKKLMILCLILLPFHAKGQEKLHTSFRVFDSSVWLRFQLNNMELMKGFSDSGFHLFRQQIEADGKVIPSSEMVRLTQNKVRRMPENVFNEIAKQNPASVIVYECLTEKRDTTKKSYSETWKQTQENDWCLLTSSIAMNNHFETALAAGFGFIDNSVAPNSVYLYTIEGIVGGDTLFTSVIVNTGRKFKTVIPEKPRIHISNNNLISIEFPSSPNYWGYELEKSNDGIQFQKPSSVPFIQSGNNNSIQIQDSILENGFHSYRYSGIDEFGIRSIPSDTVNIFTILNNYSTQLAILKCNFIDTNNTILHLNILDNAQEIKITYSDSLFGIYNTIYQGKYSDNLDINIEGDYEQRYYVAEILLSSGEILFSSPLLVQRVDTIAPCMPSKPQIVISEKNIQLHWIANKEHDIFGYRLYRADKRNFEYAPVHAGYLTDTFFTDTLPVGTLRDSIFYSITAIDKRYNESQLSEITAEEWNDFTRPPETIIGSTILGDGIIIFKTTIPKNKKITRIWLYRKVDNSMESYIPISSAQVDSAVMVLKDSTGLSEKIYRYHLITENKWGIKSQKPEDITVRFPQRIWMPTVPKPFVIADSAAGVLHLHWTYPHKDMVSHFRIYALDNNGTVKTIGTCSGNEEYFEYKYLGKQKNYTFTIIAYYKDGRKSK